MYRPRPPGCRDLHRGGDAGTRLRKGEGVAADVPFPFCRCMQPAALGLILCFLPEDKAHFTHRHVCQPLQWCLQKQKRGQERSGFFHDFFPLSNVLS